jgi:hypothetical protein
VTNVIQLSILTAGNSAMKLTHHYRFLTIASVFLCLLLPGCTLKLSTDLSKLIGINNPQQLIGSEEVKQIATKIGEGIGAKMLEGELLAEDMGKGLGNVFLEPQKGIIIEDPISVDVIENELNDSKRRLNLLEAQKNNKIRLVEINTFYGKQYDAHKQIMQIVVIVCIPVLILSVLANKGIIPPKLNALIIGIIIIIGLFIIGTKIIDLSNRDNMNYDEYNWYFNKDEAPTTSTEEDANSSSSSSDPWATTTYTCSGAECCYENSTYDETQNKCIPTAQYNANQATSTSTSTSTETTTSETEAFTVLSKYASSANFPEARLQRNIQSYNS